MSKWRKKPVVVEAEQIHIQREWGGNWESFCFAPECVVRRWFRFGWWVWTLEGWVRVRDQDWIITGVKGAKSVCKPDIFKQTYERVESGA